MKRDLLVDVGSCTGRTHAIVLTHNVDPFFVQTLVLRALRRCGHPSLTVFADGPSARESCGRVRDLVPGLGRRYRVLPVDLGHRRRWHPKAVLLTGLDAATLWVGTGNLTFGGWRDNGEVWQRFDADEDGTAPFLAVRAMLAEALSAHVPMGEAVAREVEAAFSGRWSELPPGDHRVVGRVDGPPLLDAVLGEGVRARRLTLLAPYFDARGAAVRAWRDRTGLPATDVLVSAVGHDLGAAALSAWGTSVDVRGVSGSTGEDALVHAKAVRIEHEDGHLTGWVGSANLSVAAWLAEGASGNAELVAEVTGRLAGTLLDEVELGDPPELASPPDEPTEGEGKLTVLAARWSGGVLRVAWRGPVCDRVEVVADDEELVGDATGPLAELACPKAPTWVHLVGMRGGATLRSGPLWVDDENELASGAVSRVLADVVESDGASARFEPDAWLRVMTHVARFVEPDRPAGGGGSAGPRPKAPPGEPFSVDFAALFVSGGRSSGADLVVHAGEGSLQGMIRRVLGIAGDDDDVPDDPDNDDSGDDEEKVDRPERGFAAEPRAATATERRKILAITDEVSATMGAPGWSAARGPTGVRSSLGMVGCLLGAAGTNGWLEPEELARVQESIWPTLFHDATGIGALTADDLARVATPDVAAALAAWAAGPCRAEDPAEATRARLRWAALIARWPALTEPADHAAFVSALGATVGTRVDDVLQARTEAWELAGVLSSLAAQLQGPLATWLQRVADVPTLDDGSLVWAAGRFWVTDGAVRRGDKDNVTLVAVNATRVSDRYRAGFVVPIEVLIEREMVEVSERGREAIRLLR